MFLALISLESFLVIWCIITTGYIGIKFLIHFHDALAKAKERERRSDQARIVAEAAREREERTRLEIRKERELAQREAIDFYRDINRVYATPTFEKKKSPFNIKVVETNITDCPLCREPVGEDDSCCQSCRTVTHKECLDEMSDGECPTLGCSRSSKVLA